MELLAQILAAAGGGTSGFGGGGGGGGGGGYSGSGGSGGSGDLSFGSIVFIVAVCLIVFAVGAVIEHRRRKRRRARVAEVVLHSAKAADDDAAFGADIVTERAGKLFRAIMTAWTARDEQTLARLIGPELMVEWRRRLADFERKGWHNVCELLGDPEIEYVGLVNRSEDDEDRVVVRITAEMRDFVRDRRGNVIKKNAEDDTETTLEEYWTLGKRADGQWILFSIEQDAEGRHHLESAIIATPWEDDQRLRDTSATELAVADAVPDTQVRELADLDFEGDARIAAMDLSVVDGRFAPDVLEAAARRAVDAWAEAVDGEDAPLEAIASPEAVRALLHPDGDKTRVVVRGPRLEQLRITGVDASTQPATMRVEARVAGRRYVEDRDTLALLSGSKDRATTFTERWTLALNGTGDTPWRVVGA